MKNIREIKRLALLMAIVMLFGTLLAGCTGKKPIKNEQSTTTEQPTQLEEVRSKIASTIPTYQNIEGLYDVTKKLDAEEKMVLDIKTIGDGRFFAIIVDNTDIYTSKGIVYNYEKDSIEASIVFDGVSTYRALFSHNNRIVIMDEYGKHIYLYDETLKLINKWEYEEKRAMGVSLDYASNELYVSFDTGSKIDIYNLVTLQTRNIDFSEQTNNVQIVEYIPGIQHLAVLYGDFDGILVNGYIDLKNQKLVEGSIYANNILNGDLIIEYDDINNQDKLVFRDVKSPREVKTLFIDYKEGITSKYYDISSRYVLDVEKYDNYTEVELGLYDLTTMKKVGQIEGGTFNEGSNVFGYGFDSRNSSIIPLQILESDGTANIVLWDIENVNYIDDKDYSQIAAEHKGVTLSEMWRAEAKIEEKYGVTIYTGIEAIKHFPDFAAVQMTNNELTFKALEKIEKIFSRFPAGFFGKLTYGYIKGLEIYLTGELVQGYSEGITNPIGFALEKDGKQVIVLDVNYIDELEITLAHELSHIIDHKVDYLFFEKDGFDGYYTGWYELNPKDFNYEHAYKYNGMDIDSSVLPKYTDKDERAENNIDIVYFADGYGKTFPTEDRAKIFEHLLATDEEGELKEIYQSKNLRAKAEFIFKTIREAFGIAEDEEVYWERWW